MSWCDFLISQAKDALNDTAEATVNSTAVKFQSTPEGKAVAYVSLIVMAVVPIILGSHKSVKYLKKQVADLKITGGQPDAMTTKDAAMFPIIASAALFAIYMFFKIFSKEYVNLLLSAYFFVLGVLALTQVIVNLVARYVPTSYVQHYDLKFVSSPATDLQKKEFLIDFEFTTNHIIAFGFSSLFGVWYLAQKHWIANNVFGLAFSINGIELLHLNSVATGCILLGGLFFYDIFWVFATDVMVTVAKSFEAPIKLIFPQDFLISGVFGKHFAMLGLGDIVIPGIFIALLLRYDVSLKRNSTIYFKSGLVAYTLGLIVTVVVMTIFNHAQPALLYLVPSCITIPLTVALFKGDLKSLFLYKDHPEEEAEVQPSVEHKKKE